MPYGPGSRSTLLDASALRLGSSRSCAIPVEPEHLQGVIAFLATEVANAARLWSDDPEEMQVAMRRLRDARDEVIGQRGGRVVMAMNEGDTIAAFSEVSAAALAALDLHDRVAAELSARDRCSSPCCDRGRRGSVVDGIYTGAVVDKVLRLRSVAGPGVTITSRSTADMLVDRVGRDVSIVPLEPVTGRTSLRGRDLRTHPPRRRGHAHRPGGLQSSPRAPGRTRAATHIRHEGPARSRSSWMRAASVDTGRADGRRVRADLPARPLPELGMAGLATAALGLGAAAFTGCFAWHYSKGYAAEQKQIEDGTPARGRRPRRGGRSSTSETRQRLEHGFERVTSDDGDEGARVLSGLGDEFDAMARLLERNQERPAVSLSSLLPNLTEETYRHGMSALSDALELLEFADGPQRRRLEGRAREIEDRLERGTHGDERAGRETSSARRPIGQLLARHDAARQRRDHHVRGGAVHRSAGRGPHRAGVGASRRQQGRCRRRGGDPADSIRRVRDVQDELRRLGY